MPSKQFLRVLIVAEIALIVLSVSVGVFTESSLPEPLRNYIEAEFERDMSVRDMLMVATGIPFILVWLVSSIGLYVFWRPARFLYLVALSLGFPLVSLFGPYVETGLEAMIDDAAVVVSGVILALVYFSPLKDLYDQSKTDPQQNN